MSLFSTIQMARNSLRANEIALQVVGQNIANANTPGYIREEVVLSAAPTQQLGDILLGLGVQVEGVVQRVDTFLEDRLRSSVSDRVSSEKREETYLRLEELIGELSDTDLSSSLNNFFGSIAEVLNQPESDSVRNLAVLQGDRLAGDISRLVGRTRDLRSDVNDRVVGSVDDINRLAGEIKLLNIRIAEVESSSAGNSDAVGLRDQRNAALTELAELIEIRVEEQPSGQVNIFVGGEFLVFEGFSQTVEIASTQDRGLAIGNLRIAETQAPLSPGGGEVAGLIGSRDDILGGFIDDLDDFARTLAFEFNRLFTSGQGRSGYDDIVSESAVDDVTAALDATGLSYTPVNGSFQVLVYNEQTGLTETTDVVVNLDGIGNDDTTLTDLAAALDAVDGLAATITPTRNLRLTSESTDAEFAFANDTSGVLAALGVATFFSGTDASSLDTNVVLRDDPSKFAASRGGIGSDTDNAVELAAFLDRPLETQNGPTLTVLYDGITSGVTQGASVSSAIADGFRVFENSLEAQALSVSGVNIDEEVIKMLSFQRAFQASARLIATLDELMQTLVNL